MDPPAKPLLRQLLTVVCVTGATVINSYVNGALTVALPTIGSKIGLSGQSLQWPISVYSLVGGAFLLLSGGLADAVGRKAVFVLGTAWMSVFAVPLAVSRDANEFIALCAVLGFGPAMLSPAATGILSETLPDGGLKNGAFAALGAGQPLGLFFGGIFATKYSVIFGVAAGASAVFGGLAAFFIPRSVVQTSSSPTSSANSIRPVRRRTSLLKFDWFGAALSATGLVGLTLALALAGTTSKGWKGPGVYTLLPIAICILVGFFVWERQSQRQHQAIPSADQRRTGPSSDPFSSSDDQENRSQTLYGPLIPPSIWSAPGFKPALACVWFGWLAFNALTYYCTLMFQEIQSATPIQTSIRFLPMVGAGIVANVSGGVLIGRVKAVYLILGGCIACAASCVIFATQDRLWSYARGMLPVTILVVGPDIFFPAIQLFACKTVGTHRAALAGSLFNVTTRLATSIGLAICASVQGAATQQYAARHAVSTTDKDAVMYGYRAAAWLCFASSLTAAIIAVVWLRNAIVVPDKVVIEDIALADVPVAQENGEGETQKNATGRREL